MSLETQINTIGGANGVLGTGLAGCRIDRKLEVTVQDWYKKDLYLA